MSITSLSKNTVIYSVGSLSLRLTAFLLIPLYTRYLTKSEFGLLQIILFTIQVLITVNDLGMRTAIIRFFHKYENSNKLSELFGSSFSIIMIIGLILTFSALLIPNSIISKLFGIQELPSLLFYTVIVGVFQTLSLSLLSYFRAKGEGIKYMSISIFGSILLIFLTYLFLVVLDSGILGVLWAQSITFLLIWISILLFLYSKYGLKFNSKLFITLFRFGFPLIFVMAGDLIINTSGTYLLGYFRNLEDVAIFSLAYKIAAISIMVLIGPFQMAYEPFVFKNIGKPELPDQISKITIYILLLFMLLSCGILFLFRDLILFLGPEDYSNAYYVVFFLFPGLGSMVFSYIGQSLLHINNKTNISGRVIFISTLISLVISYPLIKFYGINGLIINLNVYLIFSSLLIFHLGNKEFKIPINYLKTFLVIIISILLYFSIYKLSFYNDILFYSIVPLIMIVVFIILYFSDFFSDKEKANFKKYLGSFLSKAG